MADLFLNDQQERSVRQAQNRANQALYKANPHGLGANPNGVYARGSARQLAERIYPPSPEEPSERGFVRGVADVGVELGAGLIEGVGALLSLSEFPRRAVLESTNKFNAMQEIKQDPDRFNSLNPEQKKYVDKVVSEEYPSIFQRGLYNIFTTLANGGKLLNNAGEELTRALLSKEQQADEARVSQEIQEAMANIPPLPENASRGEQAAYIFDNIVKGGGAAAEAAYKHPGAAIGFIIRNLPLMVVGGQAGLGVKGAAYAGERAASRLGAKSVSRGLGRVATMSPGSAAAVGEGLVGAGYSAQQTGGDPRSALSGAITGLIARGGAGIARKVGVADVDVAIARKLDKGAVVNLTNKAPGRAGRAGRAAAIEGVEELLQSTEEQAFQNQATGKPWYEGVGAQGVQGMIAGAGLGGGFNALSNAPKTVQDVWNERQAVRDDQAGSLNQRLSDIENNISGLYEQAPEEFKENLNNLSEIVKQEKEFLLETVKLSNENNLDEIDYDENTLEDLEQQYEKLSFDINEKNQNTMNEENDLLARFGEGFPTYENFLKDRLEAMTAQAQTRGTALNEQYVQWKKDNEVFSGDHVNEFLKEFVSSNEDLLRKQYRQLHVRFAQNQAESSQMPTTQPSEQPSEQPIGQPVSEEQTTPEERQELLALPAREEDLSSEVMKREESERLKKERELDTIARYGEGFQSKKSFRAQKARELADQIDKEGSQAHEDYINWKIETGNVVGNHKQKFINQELNKEDIDLAYYEALLQYSNENSTKTNQEENGQGENDQENNLALPSPPKVTEKISKKKASSQNKEKEDKLKAEFGEDFQEFKDFKKKYYNKVIAKIKKEGTPEREQYIAWKKKTRNFVGDQIQKFIKQSGLINEEKIKKEYDKALLKYSKEKKEENEIQKIKIILNKYKEAKRKKGKLNKFFRQFGYVIDKLGSSFYKQYPDLREMILNRKKIYTDDFRGMIDILAEQAKPETDKKESEKNIIELPSDEEETESEAEETEDLVEVFNDLEKNNPDRLKAEARDLRKNIDLVEKAGFDLRSVVSILSRVERGLHISDKSKETFMQMSNNVGDEEVDNEEGGSRWIPPGYIETEVREQKDAREAVEEYNHLERNDPEKLKARARALQKPQNMETLKEAGFNPHSAASILSRVVHGLFISNKSRIAFQQMSDIINNEEVEEEAPVTPTSTLGRSARRLLLSKNQTVKILEKAGFNPRSAISILSRAERELNLSDKSKSELQRMIDTVDAEFAKAKEGAAANEKKRGGGAENEKKISETPKIEEGTAEGTARQPDKGEGGVLESGRGLMKIEEIEEWIEKFGEREDIEEPVKVTAYKYAKSKLGEGFHEEYPELKDRILNSKGIAINRKGSSTFIKMVDKLEKENRIKEKPTDGKDLKTIASNNPKFKTQLLRNDTHKGLLFGILSGDIENKGLDLLDLENKVITRNYLEIIKGTKYFDKLEKTYEDYLKINKDEKTKTLEDKNKSAISSAWEKLQENLGEILLDEFGSIDESRKYFNNRIENFKKENNNGEGESLSEEEQNNKTIEKEVGMGRGINYSEQSGSPNSGAEVNANTSDAAVRMYVMGLMKDRVETLPDGSRSIKYGISKSEAKEEVLEMFEKGFLTRRGKKMTPKIMEEITQSIPENIESKENKEKFNQLEIKTNEEILEESGELSENNDEGEPEELPFGVNNLGKNKNTASREEFNELFRDITDNQEPDNVHIHDTLEDAAKSVDNPDKIRAKKPFGFVVRGRGKPQVHLILENIPLNGEMAAFMHEVGGHIGMDSLPLEKRREVVNQIAKWANETNTADENKISRRALDRVRASFSGDINDEQNRSETIAYFLEEAANSGYTPNNKTKLGKFISKIVDLFQKGLEIFGIKNKKLTMQNIIDMAYGAAKVQLYEQGQGFYPDNLVEPQEISFGVNAQQLKNMVGESSKNFFIDGKHIFRKAVQSVRFLHNIIRDNKGKMPGLQEWYQNILNLDISKNSILQKVEEIVNNAKKLEQNKIDQINEFLRYSTFFQVWGYDPEIEGKKVKIDRIAKIKFDSLNKDQQKIIKDVFSHGEEMKNRMKKISEETGVTLDYFSDRRLNGPYAPLKRFGNFITEMKSQELLDAEKALEENSNAENISRVNKLKSQEEHYVISFFDTPSKAENFAEENKGKYAKINTYEKEKSMNEGLIAPQLIEQMLGKIEATVDPGVSEQFKKVLYDMYFSSLSDRDARLSGKKRMNRAGFNQDMLRSFVSHAKSQATQIAYMENGKNINQSLSDIKKQVREADGEERARRQEIYNLIIKHYNKHLRNRSNSLINTVTSANSFFMLTSSIGYHLANATQPLMVTMPKLNGDFGNVAGNWERLFNGYKIAKKAIRFNPLKQTVMIDMKKIPDRYKSLLEGLRERNILDIGLAEDLSVFDKFESGYEVIDQAGAIFANIMHRSYQVARLVESYNRISSAIAAYDLASKKGYMIRKGERISPMEYAVEVIEDTQGNFSNLDAPYLIKYLPKVTTQFRKFQFMMAHLYVDSFMKAFKGKDAHEREVGRRTLGWLLAHTGLIAGLNGVPLSSSISGLFMLMGGSDEPKDLEEYIRKHTKDKAFATLLAKGIPAFLGVDMERLGQQGLFSPLPYNRFSVKTADKDYKDAIVSAVGGPASATGLNFFRGVRELGNGDYLKGVGHMMPKGIRNALEAYGYATEGYKLNNGDVIVDPRDIDFITLLSNFIGLTPQQISNLRWTNAQQNEIKDYYSRTQTKLKKEFTDARAKHDSRKMAEIRREWRQLQKDKDNIRWFFNDSRKSLKKSPLSDLYKYKESQETRTKTERERLTGS